MEIIANITVNTKNDFIQKFKTIESCFERTQIDCFDGVAVDNKTFYDYEYIKKLQSNLKYDFHLITQRPEVDIKEIVKIKNASRIIFHMESLVNVNNALKLIKEARKEVGIALNPETPLSVLNPFLADIDLVLIMSVIPGYYGSPFISGTFDKVKELKNLLLAKNLQDIKIAVDGGIKDSNIKLLQDCGVDIFYVGSFMFAGDIKEQKNKLIRALKD